jgi:hypothetical protein
MKRIGKMSEISLRTNQSAFRRKAGGVNSITGLAKDIEKRAAYEIGSDVTLKLPAVPTSRDRECARCGSSTAQQICALRNYLKVLQF